MTLELVIAIISASGVVIGAVISAAGRIIAARLERSKKKIESGSKE